MLVIKMIFKDTAAFKYYLQFLYSVLGTSLLRRRSTVALTYLKVKSAKCRFNCLLPVVLVLILVL